MFCPKCGSQNPNDARFCSSCGEDLTIYRDDADIPAGMVPERYRAIRDVMGDEMTHRNPDNTYSDADQQDYTAGGEYVTPNIVHCPDGKYRWMYEMPMLSNPTLMITILKVIALTFGILIGILFVADLIGGNLDTFIGSLPVILIVCGVFLVLGVVSYLIVVIWFGGKYIVFFEMDEKGVDHIQAPYQYKKAEAIKVLGALAGIASPNVPALTGIALLIGTNNVQSSNWDSVKNVKVVRKRHVIYVNEMLIKNQVYAADGDFDFVENYIMTHCTNLEK